LAFPLPARTREVITVEQFRALSARLTGASPDALDVGAAAKLLDGFVSMGRGADLARLAADPGATGPLADDIVAAWYSGTYHTRNGLASFGRASRLAAGPQFCRSRWETGLLRQRELHPDLPDRREIRRDHSNHQRRLFATSGITGFPGQAGQ
jgi:hypothetical protein